MTDELDAARAAWGEAVSDPTLRDDFIGGAELAALIGVSPNRIRLALWNHSKGATDDLGDVLPEPVGKVSGHLWRRDEVEAALERITARKTRPGRRAKQSENG